MGPVVGQYGLVRALQLVRALPGARQVVRARVLRPTSRAATVARESQWHQHKPRAPARWRPRMGPAPACPAHLPCNDRGFPAGTPRRVVAVRRWCLRAQAPFAVASMPVRHPGFDAAGARMPRCAPARWARARRRHCRPAAAKARRTWTHGHDWAGAECRLPVLVDRGQIRLSRLPLAPPAGHAAGGRPRRLERATAAAGPARPPMPRPASPRRRRRCSSAARAP